MEYSPDQVNFLDTTVIIDKLKISVTLNYTLNQQIHTRISTGPHHITNLCKTKGPYGQFLRIREICHKHEDFQMDCTGLIGYYQERGYPIEILLEQYNRANLFIQNMALRSSTNEMNLVQT
jgi:hypothetical protein